MKTVAILLLCLAPLSFSGTLAWALPEVTAAPTGRLSNAGALAPFFGQLAAAPGRQVRIAHIGDSHVQADWFPQAVRDSLQAWYGAGGRGWVFPFSVAKTHGPRDVVWSAGGVWSAKKMVSTAETPACGFGGYVLETTDPKAWLTATLKADSVRTPAYRYWEIWTEKGPGHYDALASAEGEERLLLLGAARRGAPSYRSLIDFEKPVAQLRVQPAGSGSKFRLYGMAAYDQLDRGVTYFASGINGARFDHYLRAPVFWEQLKEMKPDLVVVSLGANDSHTRKFDSVSFRTQVTQTLARIREAQPEASILLTTPPGAWIYGKPNPANTLAAALLVDIAREQDAACWDFFSIAGGEGGLADWKQNGLAHTDLVHLNKPGYFLQGALLALDLRHAYESYRLGFAR